MNHAQRKEAGLDANRLLQQARLWAAELGFSQIGVTGVDLSCAEPGLSQWLAQGFHGSMDYMAAHGMKRARPAELVPGTISVLTARMDYLPRDLPGTPPDPPQNAPAGRLRACHASKTIAPPTDWRRAQLQSLQNPSQAVVSLYARGRDYHKVLRSRLQKLCERMACAIGPFGHRVFTDSAPVLEAELAVRSGQGWRGKHTLVLSRQGGSFFFLGEIYLDFALPTSAPASAHCGQCRACLDACPTQAIVAPWRLDARRCISYLSIEHPGPIPEPLRPAIGNRIYGCDDCQLVCPWNKFARASPLPDFASRPALTQRTLAELFAWSQADFLRHTEGSPIRRIGHERWLRNLAVALGNALRVSPAGPVRAALCAALQSRAGHPDALVREHVNWALSQMGRAPPAIK